LEQLQTLAADVAEFIGNAETTASDTYTDLTTPGPTVTVPVGPFGLLLIGLSAELRNDATNGHCGMGYTLSGANTLAADTSRTLWHNSEVAGGTDHKGIVFLVDALTPGPTTVTAKYRRGSSGGNATFNYRRVWAIPL
jgi:hypothetical protein